MKKILGFIFAAILFAQIMSINTLAECTSPYCSNQKCSEAVQKYYDLFSIEDKKEFYMEFRKLENEYAEWVDPVEKIYDVFTEAEIDKMFGVVEAEVGSYGFDEKVNVANVILNRVYDDRFPDSLNKVLSASQFSTVSSGAYLKKKISDETMLACEYAFIFGDTTNGAIYFESKGSNSHGSYATLTMTDNSGHKFYK